MTAPVSSPSQAEREATGRTGTTPGKAQATPAPRAAPGEVDAVERGEDVVPPVPVAPP